MQAMGDKCWGGRYIVDMPARTRRLAGVFEGVSAAGAAQAVGWALGSPWPVPLGYDAV